MLSFSKVARISLFSIVAVITFYLAVNNLVRMFNWPQIHYVFSFENDRAIVQKVKENETFLRNGDILRTIDGTEIHTKLGLLRELWAKPLAFERTIVIERNGDTLRKGLTLDHRFSYPQNILRIMLAGLLFVLGIFIFYKRMLIHSVRNLSYLYVMYAYAVSVPISERSGTDPLSILIPFWWAILFTMIPPLTLNFALRFPYKKKILKKRPYIAALAYIPTALFLPTILYTLWEGGLYKELESYPLHNTIYKMFSGYMLVYVVITFYILFNVLRNPMQRKQKMQVLWFIYGSAVGLFPYMFLRVLPKLFGFETLISWEMILVMLFAVPISWAISVFAYQLFDVEVVINRSLVYFTVLSSLAVLYILIIYLSSSYLGSFYDIHSKFFMTLTIVGALLLFEPARRRIQYLIDRFFYRDWYSYRNTLLQLGRQLSSSSDTHTLYEELVKRLFEILYLHNAIIVELIEEKPGNISTFRLSAAHGLTEEEILSSNNLTDGFDLDMSSPIMAKFVENLNPLHVDQIWIFPDVPEDLKVLRGDMENFHTQLFVPIVLNNKLMGILCLGKKRSGASFSFKDIQLLKSLQHEVCLAIKNSDLIQGLIEAERLVKEQEIENLHLESENKQKEIELDAATKREKVLRELEKSHKELRIAHEDLKDAQSQLVQSEKMASLGMLVAGVAHEINTPLGAVMSMHDTLIRGVDKMKGFVASSSASKTTSKDNVQKTIDIINDADKVINIGNARIRQIVKRLKSFARLDEAEMQTVDVNECLEETIKLFKHALKDKVKLIKNFNNLPEVACYPAKLNQVFLNLLINSNQAIDKEGEISINTYTENGNICITIIDNGEGIPKKSLDKIFDPGFTTKGVGVGTGLGLSISYRIIREHKGDISVESKEGEGSTFKITIPIDLESKIKGTE